MKTADLFATPDHYLFAFDGDQSLFADMNRSAYERSIFLDRRIVAASPRILRVPTAGLAEYRQRNVREAPSIGWIFHIAHCGSTLLARGLDRASDDLVLREPMVLRQLGVAASAGRDGAQSNQQLAMAAAMLGKRYRASAPVIVKANVPVNFIVPQLLALNPVAPAIFLYFTLDDYLAAVLRTANHRQWVASITSELRVSIEEQVGSVGGLPIEQLAAALWLAQMRVYAAALASHDQARSLDAEQLFNAPRGVLTAAFAHFGIAISEAQIGAILQGELLSTYSKNPQVAFDNSQRTQRQAQLKRELANELRSAREWIESRLPAHPLPDRLAKPLVGDSPELLRRG